MTAPVASPLPPRAIGVIHWLGIATLYRREMIRYTRWWFESIANPVVSTGLFVLVFALAFGDDLETEEGWLAFQYLLPGLAVYSMLAQAVEATLFSLCFDKIEGNVTDILMPPLAPLEFVIAYLMSALTSAIVTGALLLPILLTVAGTGPANLVLVVVFGIGGAMMLALAGFIVALLAKKWDQAEAFMAFVMTPAVFLSGVFAPVDRLPDPLPFLVQLSPVYAVVDGFRAGAIGVHDGDLLRNGLVVAATVAGLMVIARQMVARGIGLRD